MRIKLIIGLFVLILSACISSSQEIILSDNLENNELVKKVFLTNNENRNDFGFERNQNEPDISITSIFIHENDIYLLDRYHGNIKRYNITDDKLYTSELIDVQKNPWINDLIYFNDKLVIINDLDSIYILDDHLEKERSISCPSGEKYFSHISELEFEIYNNLRNECYTFNSSFDQTSTNKCNKEVVWTYSLLKDYQEVKSDTNIIIFLPEINLRITDPVPGEHVNYIGRFFDYNEIWITYFDIFNNKLVLYYFPYK